MATLPQQAPGPGPTAQALPSYLSYSPAATQTLVFTSTITDVVYDPLGSFAPYQTTNVVEGTSTSVDYSIVNVPLLYTGPFPAPPLGTLYTTPGEVLPTPSSPATQASPTSAPSATPTAAPTQASTESSNIPSPSDASSIPPESSANSPTGPSATEGASFTPESAPNTVQSPSSTNPNVSALSTSAASATSLPSTLPTGTTATNPSASNSSTASQTNANSGTATAGPSPTTAGVPNAGIRSARGLSGGQIAGIVLGTVFGLLLLLLLLLCCLRQRRQQRGSSAAAAAGAGTAGGSSRFGRGFSRGASRGRYAAVGAGVGLVGASAADAAGGGARGSLDSDEWEEDHLTGGGDGSGFFVVGGRRLGTDRRESIASRRSRNHPPSPSAADANFTTANVAPSANNGSKATGKSSQTGFAGLLAGASLLGAAFGFKSRNKRDKPRVEIEDEEHPPLSEKEAREGDTSERRGLLQFGGSPPSGYGSAPEMREAGRSGLRPAAALAGATGAAAYFASRRPGQDRDFEPGRPTQNNGSSLGSSGRERGMDSRQTSDTHSGSGPLSTATAPSGNPASQGSGSAGMTLSSSNSTGGRTGSGSGSGASLPPPPRAPRGARQTYANIGAPASLTATPFEEAQEFDAPTDSYPRVSNETADSLASGRGGLNPALLGVGAGVMGGLGALAAGHRESGGSTYSRGHYPSEAFDPQEQPAYQTDSQISNLSPEELGHLRSTDPGRYSRFISAGTNLLGPSFQNASNQEKESQFPSEASGPFQSGTLGTGNTFQRTRLPTIRSVGEFGERSDIGDNVTPSGTLGSASLGAGSGHAFSAAGSSLGDPSAIRSQMGPSPLPQYEERQLQAGETLPQYTMRAVGPSPSTGQAQIGSTVGEAQAGFQTPPSSPQNTRGEATRLRDADTSDLEAARPDDPLIENGDDMDGARPDQPEGQVAGSAAASAGILGGVAAGWRRLTMGQYAWIPGSTPRGDRSSSRKESSLELDGSDARISNDYDTSDRSTHQQFRQGRASLASASEAGLAPEVRSERASVYNPSALGHGTHHGSPVTRLSSKEGSGSSNERRRNASSQDTGAGGAVSGAAVVGALGALAASQRSQPSLSSHHSSARSRGGGYAASYSNSNSSMSGRRTGSDLDSLSAVAQLSSRSTGSRSSRSGNRSSSRGGRSGGVSDVSIGGGSSSGAASYNPSGVLTRGNTTSTRGVDDETSPDGAEDGNAESDLASSRATQGGSSSSIERRKRPRSSSVEGLSRLGSVREVVEGGASDPFADSAATVPPVPQDGFPPPDSLGAAEAHSDARRADHGRDASSASNASRSQQPSAIRSLQPGIAAPAPARIAASLSAPSLTSSSNDMEGANPVIPASASWRPSPRVASAAQRAAEAQARLQQQQQEPQQRQQLGFQGGPTPPRSSAASPSNSQARPGATYNWGDLDSTFRRAETRPSSGPPPDDLEADMSGQQDPEPANKTFDWPKFLRF